MGLDSYIKSTVSSLLGNGTKAIGIRKYKEQDVVILLHGEKYFLVLANQSFSMIARFRNSIPKTEEVNGKDLIWKYGGIGENKYSHLIQLLYNKPRIN